MSKLLDLLKAAAGEISLSSRLGKWAQAVSQLESADAAAVAALQTAQGQDAANIAALQTLEAQDAAAIAALQPLNPLAPATELGQTAFFNGRVWMLSQPSAPIQSIQIVGDSEWRGSNGTDSGMVAVARQAVYQQLRAWRDDFDFIGSDVTSPEGVASFGLWASESHPGATIATTTAAYAGYIAITGTSNLIVDMLGTNDIVADGLTAAQMLVRRQALDAAYVADNPSAVVIAMGIPPFVAGTTVGANLAAWNATRNAYNALLQAYVATKTNYFYSNATDVLGEGDFQSDGVHLNQYGQAKMGQRIATLVDLILGPRRGNILPNTFLQRKPWSMINIAVAATSTLTATAHDGFSPAAGNFAYAMDLYPTTLDAGALHSIVQYGPYAGAASGAGFWAIYQQGAKCRVYFDSGTGTIVNQVSDVSLLLNTWHRIVLIAQANGANSSVGLYVNAKLVGLTQGLPAWNMPLGLNTIVGNDTFTGCPGYVGRIAAYKGPNVPAPGHMAALQAVEEDYYKGRDLVPGAGTAVFALNAGLADDIAGNPAFVAAGGAVSLGAWPTGPARPWEYAGG